MKRIFRYLLLITIIPFVSSCNRHLPTGSTSKLSLKKYGNIDAYIISNPLLGIDDGDRWWTHTKEVTGENLELYLGLLNKKRSLYYKRGSSWTKNENGKIIFKGNITGCYQADHDRLIVFVENEISRFTITNDDEKKCFCQAIKDETLKNVILSRYAENLENTAYEYARSKNTVAGYREFLGKYPYSKHKSKDNTNIQQI